MIHEKCLLRPPLNMFVTVFIVRASDSDPNCFFFSENQFLQLTAALSVWNLNITSKCSTANNYTYRFSLVTCEINSSKYTDYTCRSHICTWDYSLQASVYTIPLNIRHFVFYMIYTTQPGGMNWMLVYRDQERLRSIGSVPNRVIVYQYLMKRNRLPITVVSVCLCCTNGKRRMRPVEVRWKSCALAGFSHRFNLIGSCQNTYIRSLNKHFAAYANLHCMPMLTLRSDLLCQQKDSFVNWNQLICVDCQQVIGLCFALIPH